VRGSSWYADTNASFTAAWKLYYCGNGLTAQSVVLSYTAADATPTNMHNWTVSTNLTGITAGDSFRYWLSRDITDTGDGTNYIEDAAIGFHQE